MVKYNQRLVKPAKFKNKFSSFNLKIVANGYKLKNYKIAIGNSSVKFYKKRHRQVANTTTDAFCRLLL